MTKAEWPTAVRYADGRGPLSRGRSCFQLLERKRALVLDVAESFVAEQRRVVVVGALPGLIVRRAPKVST